MIKLNEIIDFKDLPTPGRGFAVTIGNFDGAHIGHQKLIETTITRAKTIGVSALAISFSPGPKTFFGKYQEDPLFSDEQKLRAFAELNLDAAYIQKFDQVFSELSAEEFITKFLIEQLNIKAVVVGYDFAFGHKRQGNTEMLREWGEKADFTVDVIPAQTIHNNVVGSGSIRRYLQEGHVELATTLLNRPFAVEGIIRQGAQLGRTIGIPTANLSNMSQLLPKTGVYAGHVYFPKEHDSSVYLTKQNPMSQPAVINIGITPTVERAERSIKVEAHLLDYSGEKELYGKKACFYFEHFLRDEQKFASLDALKQQIAQDISKARTYF